MRIGLVSFAWTEQNNGGLRSHVHDLANDLNKLGAKVFVHCVNTDRNAPAFETKSWKEGEISIQELNYANQFASTLFDFQAIPQTEVILKEWALREKLDIAHVHHNLFIGMGAIPALAQCCPVLTTLHDYWPIDPLGQLFAHNSSDSLANPRHWEERLLAIWPEVIKKSRESHKYYSNQDGDISSQPYELMNNWIRFSKKCLNKSQILIAPSAACSKVFQEFNVKQPIVVVENGIQTAGLKNRLQLDHQRSNKPVGKIKLSILGNIVPPKGQLAFCKSCLALPFKEEIEVYLHGSFPQDFHGDAKPQDELRQLCHDYPNLFFHRGPYTRDKLPDIYSQTDIAVTPSIWEEVYGLVARESLCYGLPLITTTAGGLYDLRHISTALILDHTRPSEWASTLAHAYAEGPLLKWVYNRRNGVPNSTYTPRTSLECAADLSAIYQATLSENTKSPQALFNRLAL